MVIEDFYAALTPDYNETYKCDMCRKEYKVAEMSFINVPPLYDYFSKPYIICWNCSTKIINGDSQAIKWLNKHIRRKDEEE